jgi:Xaa-Pro aminopeptidase
MRETLCSLILCISFSVYAQTADQPNDFLNKEFHRIRRDKLRESLPPKSVAVFFANATRNRSNDVEYRYHQDTDFYYLTGYREPHAVLLIFKETQLAANGKPYNEIIFVQPRNITQEMWTGRRLGDIKTKEMLGLDQAFNNTEFRNYNVDFKKFDQILFKEFFNDVRDDQEQENDLYDLIDQFKQKVSYPDKDNSLTVEHGPNNLNTAQLDIIMNNLRGIKTPEELSLLRRAVQISCRGQVETMKAMKPGMSEREIQGIHEFVFKKYQAEDQGYPSIVGGGHNGCILHYIENYKPSINTKELVLMDLGAEYHGYTADITRTIPANGKFSPEQKQIYDLVLKAQEAGMKICKPGTSFSELTRVTQNAISQGLKELGITQKDDEFFMYYPHGCCHHIGLDVHDRGNYSNLTENMVITIEPGIYIPDDARCDPKWRGIAVRIEDDFLITKNGCELLSISAPRTTEDIESVMALPSPLDDFDLPAIPSR